MSEDCPYCIVSMKLEPIYDCPEVAHWKRFASHLSEKIELHDDDRDKLDVAEWLSTYKKVNKYNCHACKRHYELPTHMTHFVCVCGHRCRLRHVGGTNPDEAVIDAAIAYFGNERSAQLAWIAEVVAGEHCLNYTADEIRDMIRREMDRWVLDGGWRRKDGKD